jgi:hypothetical protein
MLSCYLPKSFFVWNKCSSANSVRLFIAINADPHNASRERSNTDISDFKNGRHFIAAACNAVSDQADVKEPGAHDDAAGQAARQRLIAWKR